MFQNISSEEINNEGREENIGSANKTMHMLKSMFSIQNIILYILALAVSMVSFNGNLAPFALAIFAAVCGNRIAAGVVYIACLIGTFIGFGISGALIYIFTTILFIAMVLILKPKYGDETRNEKQKVGLHLFASTLIVSIIPLFFGTFLMYDLVSVLMLAITTYIFYKIFVNSLTVVTEYTKKQAFSIEEVLGASLLFVIAFSSFANLNIWGLSITNILSIMLVLFLGWRNGILAGATAGIAIGVILGLVTGVTPVVISSFAISRNASPEYLIDLEK